MPLEEEKYLVQIQMEKAGIEFPEAIVVLHKEGKISEEFLKTLSANDWEAVFYASELASPLEKLALESERRLRQ